MNIQNLPAEILSNVIGKCNFRTVLKIKRTCSLMKEFIDETPFDKIQVKKIKFAKQVCYDRWLRVTIEGCSILAEFHKDGFDRSYDLFSTETPNEVLHRQKIQQLLRSIKTLGTIEFWKIIINEEVVQMLKSFPIEWKSVIAKFDRCNYRIPVNDLLLFWKMFKSVNECGSQFIDGQPEQVITDEVMLQTLPTITFSASSTDQDRFVANLNITDKTLELLEKHRPPIICMDCFTANYTLEGVKKLFEKIIEVRDPKIQNWLIGAIDLEPIDFYPTVESFDIFRNEYTNVIVEQEWKQDRCKITIEYTKENLTEKGNLAVVLNKPYVLRVNELMMQNLGIQ